MTTKAKELTSCEVQLLAVDIARVLEQCPRYNLIEVLECAADMRNSEGDVEDVDYVELTSSDEDGTDSESEEEEEEEEEVESD